MTDGDGSVVAGRGEQRISLMILDRAKGIGVEAQRLVRQAGQVEVEPEHLLVECADQQVVAARVD